MGRAARCCLYAGIAAALAACGRGFAVEGRVEGAFDVPDGVSAVRVRVPSGSITVEGTAGGGIRYEGATLKAASRAEVLDRLLPVMLDLTATRSGDVLELTAPALPEGLEDPGAALVLRMSMTVPRNLALELETGRGPVAVVGRDAAVTVRTGSGDLRLDGVRGDAFATTRSGNAIVAGHAGSLELLSEDGDQVVYIDRMGEAGVRLTVGTGNVQCSLPPAAGLELDLRTELGKITSGFPIPVERIGKAGHAGAARVGGGGPQVVLRARVGNLSIRPFARG
jgi:hypothetical protein